MPTVWRHEYAALTTLHQPPCSSFSYCLCWYSQVSHSNRSWPVTLRLTLQMSVSRLSEMLLQSSCLAGDGEKCEKERERSQFGGERSSQQLHKACLNVTTWFRCRCANSPGVSWRTLCFPFLKKSNSVAIMTAACQQVSVASDIPEKERKHLRRSLLSSADLDKWNPAPSFIAPRSQDEFLRYGKNAFNIKIKKQTNKICLAGRLDLPLFPGFHPRCHIWLNDWILQWHTNTLLIFTAFIWYHFLLTSTQTPAACYLRLNTSSCYFSSYLQVQWSTALIRYVSLEEWALLSLTEENHRGARGFSFL